MPAERYTNTSIRINPEVWRRAKIAAARAPMTVGEYVEEALLTKLTDEKADKQTA